MEVLSASQMQATDRYAIDQLQIPSLILMEGAALALFNRLRVDFPASLSRGVWILCGKGNNGGDGLALARLLTREGVQTAALCPFPEGSLSTDGQIQWHAAVGSGVSICRDWEELQAAQPSSPGLIVDALLGTGITGGAREPIRTLIRILNQQRLPTVAVDIPSGLDSDAWSFAGEAVTASHTYTLCRPKPALISAENRRWVGTLSVLPIGIPNRAVEAAGSRVEWLDRSSCQGLLARREPDSHKGTFGHLGLFAGSPDMPGAALLAGRAAIRAGVGLATVAGALVADGNAAAADFPELMHRSLPYGRETGYETSLPSEFLAAVDALAVGPGLGRSPQTQERIREAVSQCDGPLVVDADGLNAFPELAGWNSRPNETLLTPHPGEAARLLGVQTAEIQADRQQSARALAKRTQAVILLKGPATVVACPLGRIAINSTGNAGLATAGSGDVLTGLTGALLAQGLSAWDSGRLGAYLHGLAGDRARDHLGEASLTASDLISTLPLAIEDLHSYRRASRW